MTLKERYCATLAPDKRHGDRSYEKWLEAEVAWYRDWADKLAQTLAGTADEMSYYRGRQREDLYALLTQYQHRRNDKDFDG